MINVASYCRVSTDKDDQSNSFESQQRYFREYINRQPDWNLYDVYADEGITGTSTKKRTEFNRMMNDAYMGRFKLILTKEVSRFSRNILDTISYTRELHQLGVGVIFMNDGISTLDPDAELRLSIMGSIAQEESRKTSSRVKWGQTRQMERGVVFGRSLLGYDVKDGKLTVNPEGAEIVRLIFHKYGIEKKGTSIIARELREANYKTYRGSTIWSNSHIVKILKNEKYVGDLVQKKTITPDYLTHARKYNHSKEALICLKNHHEPIIHRELWDLVQAELEKRSRHNGQSSGHSNRYIFSGKIKCGECKASFVSRKRVRKDGSTYRRWNCYTAVREGCRHTDPQGNNVGCAVGRSIRDETAMELLQMSLQSIQMDRNWLIENVTALALEGIQSDEWGRTDSREKLQSEIEQLKEKKLSMLDAFFGKSITREEMEMMNKRYDEKIASLQKQLNVVCKRTQSYCGMDTVRDEVRSHVERAVNAQTDSEIFYKNLLNRIVVCKDGSAEISLNLLPQTWVYALES